VTKCFIANVVFWSHFVVILKSDFNAQQTGLKGGLIENLSDNKVAHQSVTKFTIAKVGFWSHFAV
jgi:hypothetical protein